MFIVLQNNTAQASLQLRYIRCTKCYRYLSLYQSALIVIFRSTSVFRSHFILLSFNKATINNRISANRYPWCLLSMFVSIRTGEVSIMCKSLNNYSLINSAQTTLHLQCIQYTKSFGKQWVTGFCRLMLDLLRHLFRPIYRCCFHTNSWFKSVIHIRCVSQFVALKFIL